MVGFSSTSCFKVLLLTLNDHPLLDLISMDRSQSFIEPVLSSTVRYYFIFFYFPVSLSSFEA